MEVLELKNIKRIGLVCFLLAVSVLVSDNEAWPLKSFKDGWNAFTFVFIYTYIFFAVAFGFSIAVNFIVDSVKKIFK